MHGARRIPGFFLGLVLFAVGLPNPAFAQGAGPFQFVELSPCRIVDTRSTHPPILQSGVESKFPIQDNQGNCGVPLGAAAVAVNITAVNPTGQGRLTAYPSDITPPTVASINFPAGTAALANGAIVPLAAQSPQAPDDMAIMPFVVNNGQVHMVLDVAGYFIAPSGTTLPFHSVSPCRIVDTRLNGQVQGQYGPILQSGVERQFPVQGNCGVPTGAKAATVNITAVTPSSQGRLTAFPSGVTAPPNSSINFPAGTTALANGAIVPLASGTPDLAILPFVLNNGNVHLVLDVTGYFLQ